MPKRKRRGHTLMEMLVVITIILITIGLLMPCYMRAVQMARRTANQHGGSRQER